jgi:hypothetical protein
MSDESDPRLYHAHIARNREPILEVLRRIFRPENGSYKLVARVRIDEWHRIAKAAKVDTRPLAEIPQPPTPLPH